MHRYLWICWIKSLTPGASEKSIFLDQSAVPITGTGALAEKAKTWKGKPTKGTRQVSPVASAEGMSIFVLSSSEFDASIDHSNKDGPTVYQKRSQVLIRKDLYTWWDLPSGGVSNSFSRELRSIKRRG